MQINSWPNKHSSFNITFALVLECLFCLFSTSLKKFFVPWRKFRSPYPGKAQQPHKQCYPFLSVCITFLCSQTMVWLLVFGIFNPHADVKACNCTRRLYRHCMRVCTGSWLREKNPCHTRDSNLRQFCSWLFNRTLFQLSYICPLREEPECNILFPCANFF